MAVPIDPGTIASLQNTLGPAGVLTLLQAQQERDQAERAKRVGQATAQAGQAQQAYGQAAAAPAPEPSPLEQALPTLFGNIAAAISENPSYRQAGLANVQQKRKDLAQTRADNLGALKDMWDQKAKLAASMGDQQTELEARTKSEQIARVHADLTASNAEGAARALEDLKNKGDLAVQGLRNKGALDVANVEAAAKRDTAAGTQTYDIKPLTRHTASGKTYVSLGSLVGNPKNAAIKAAGDAGLVALGPADEQGVKDVDRARRDVRKLDAYLSPLLPGSPQERITNYGQRKFSEIFQTKAQRSAFRTWRDAAIPILRALAGSRNLRMTQEQIRMSIANLPTLHDTYETAQTKLSIIESLLDNAEAPLIDTDFRQNNDPGGVR